MKKIAIIQSNYIPWKGYFHIIQKVDHFVFLDEVQYTCRDWRNRNRIKSPEGLIWLTVPNDGDQSKKISDVRIDNSVNWNENHYSSMRNFYRKTKYYSLYESFLQEIYLNNSWEYLYDLNQFLIKKIAAILNIKTYFHNSSEFDLLKGKNEKIISIVKQLGGNHYLTGPAASAYLKPELFRNNNIILEYMDYSNYPEYPQPWGNFCHQVSIMDLLFCTGPEATLYIWS